MKTGDRLHYTACGLDNVWLMNGFERRETPHGRGFAILDARKLHGAIARSLIVAPYRMRGQELRFLRAQLDLSQTALAKVLGTTRPSLARWEGRPGEKIPAYADRSLRMFYALNAVGHVQARKLIEMLKAMDERQHADVLFRERADDWERVPEQRAA